MHKTGQLNKFRNTETIYEKTGQSGERRGPKLDHCDHAEALELISSAIYHKNYSIQSKVNSVRKRLNRRILSNLYQLKISYQFTGKK